MTRLPRTARRRTIRLGTTAVLLALAAVATTACTDSGTDSTDSSQADEFAAGGSADMPPGERPASQREDGQAADGSGQVGRPIVDKVAIVAEYQVKNGTVSIAAQDVAGVLDKVYQLAVTTRGEIASEDTSTNRDGEPVRSNILLLVPVAAFDSSLNQVAGFGTLLTKTRSSETVTAAVADIDSRVENAQDSIDELRRLFSQARKLSDIILLENELTERESELEALQAQQRALQAETSMSRITVTVSQPKTEPSTGTDDDRAGFLAGITQGWDAMVTFVRAASHALGLVLPLAILGLVLSLIGWVGLRRIRPRLRTGTSE